MADPPESTTVDADEVDAPKSPVDEGVGMDKNSSDGGDNTSTDNVSEGDSKGEKEHAKAAPQAQTIDQDDGAVDEVKLTPQYYQNQRQNMKDVLSNESTAALPPLMASEDEGGANDANAANDGGKADNCRTTTSALHRDEYSQYRGGSDRQQHDPRNHESALSAPHSGGRDSSNNHHYDNQHNGSRRFARKKKTRLQEAGAGGGRHSHPRKSPYRSEVARLRHAQQLEREKRQFGIQDGGGDDGGSESTGGRGLTLKETTGPPETASFAIQSSKFKHSLLHSLGEFLTSAFADDEEASGSYFSQELLDQLSASNPHLRGVWLQAKGLNDDHVRQLCDALIRNKVVTEVWLPSNYITDEGAAHIAHMLKFNRAIKELFLGNNDIGPKGAAALASALARGNSTLVALGLGDNHIGVEGAGAFAAALRHNHSLHTLDVKNNGIPKRSSIRGLLHKMLEYNASDPGDESLVLGLQEELANLVSSLPPDAAETLVMQAEEALKMAMLCRKRGDRVGAAEAEGIFIRICTTGEPPVDPPEEMVAATMAGGGRRDDGTRKPQEPDHTEGLGGQGGGADPDDSIKHPPSDDTKGGDGEPTTQEKGHPGDMRKENGDKEVAIEKGGGDEEKEETK